MRHTVFMLIMLIAATGCSKPETVAHLDMNTYWYSAASNVAATTTGCRSVMTMSGSSKVKCE